MKHLPGLTELLLEMKCLQGAASCRGSGQVYKPGAPCLLPQVQPGSGLGLTWEVPPASSSSQAPDLHSSALQCPARKRATKVITSKRSSSTEHIFEVFFSQLLAVNIYYSEIQSTI